MKEIRFKIIELPDYQVLVMKEWDDDDEPRLSFVFFLEGIKVTQSLGFKTEEALQAAFDKTDAEGAKIMVDMVLETL